MEDQGYTIAQSDTQDQKAMPASTSISEDLVKLCVSGLFVLLVILTVTICIYYYNKYISQRVPRQLLDRQAELN